MRNNFLLFNDNKVVFLDSAAGHLKPKSVVEAISNFYHFYPINPHSIDSALGVEVAKKIDLAREKVADLVFAKKQEVIFTSGTTDGLNKISLMLESILTPNKKIVLSPYNHSSNILPFMELAKKIKARVIFSKSIANDIDKDTILVSYAQTNNTINVDLNMQDIFTKAKSVGALVINDAAQAIAHEKVSLEYSDVIVFSGNKLYGPTGIGALIVKDELLKKLKPAFLGGGMVAKMDKSSYITKEGVSKFEAGTPNTAGIIGLLVAIDFLNSNIKQIQETEKELALYAYKKLQEIEGIKIYSKLGDLIIHFNIKEFAAQDVVSFLGHKNIILRAGAHCAHLLESQINTASSIRLSIASYNNHSDIERLVEAIKKGGDFLDFI